jgi:hypothetical protein
VSGSQLSDQPRIFRGLAHSSGAQAANTDYIFVTTGFQVATSSNGGQGAVDWRAVDWRIYDKALYWRLRLWMRTHGVAPATTVYVTAYAATASLTTNGAVVLGAEVPGMRGPTVELAAAGAAYELTTPMAAAPADGMYVPVFHTNAAWAAGSGALATGALEVFAR